MTIFHPVNQHAQGTSSEALLMPHRRLNQLLKSVVTVFTPPEMPPVPAGLHISKRAWRRNAAAIMAIRSSSR